MSDTSSIELGKFKPSSDEKSSWEIPLEKTLRKLYEQSPPKGTFVDFLKQKDIEITRDNMLFIERMFRHLKCNLHLALVLLFIVLFLQLHLLFMYTTSLFLT
jgi:hypothetical protein